MSLLNLSDLEDFINDLEENTFSDILEGMDSDEDRQQVREWILIKINDFHQRCKVVNDEIEFQQLMLWFYIQLKSEWSQMNTRIQYSQLNGHELDMSLIYKSSIMSITIREFERFINLLTVENITTFLSDPAKLENAEAIFSILAKEHTRLEESAEVLQSEHKRTYTTVKELIDEIESNSDLKKESINGRLTYLLSEQHRISQFSSELRKGIIELKQTVANTLFQRLEQFWHDVVSDTNISGNFSLIGAQVTLDSNISDLLLDPLALLLRTIIITVEENNANVSLTLNVRYSGSELLVSLDGICDDDSTLDRILRIESYDEVYFPEARQQIQNLKSKIEIYQPTPDSFSFLMQLRNRSNVMNECVLFEADGLTLSISRASVNQIIEMEPNKLRYTDQIPMYTYRDEIYSYISIGEEIGADIEATKIILIEHNGVSLAIGVETVNGFDTVSLQAIDSNLRGSKCIRNVGITALGVLTSYVELEQLINKHQINQL